MKRIVPARIFSSVPRESGTEKLMEQVQQSINNSTFVNKRVVILGGSSGIGLAVAHQVVEGGGEVVIASSTAARVREAVAGLGAKAEGYTVDLADENAIQKLFSTLASFDHLVITAGDSLQLNSLSDMDMKKARQAFELRFFGALTAVKYARPCLREGGSIVLTTGIAGDRPQKGWALSAGVCGAVVSLTRALAVELAPIRVNAVSPGVVRTNLWRDIAESDRENMYASIGNTLLVGRVGEADEIARAYTFLMKEGFSTGQTVVVDGGTVLV